VAEDLGDTRKTQRIQLVNLDRSNHSGKDHLLKYGRDTVADDAVLRYSQICRLPKADPSNLNFFRKWLDHDEGGHLFLQGREAWTWDSSHTKDIMSMSAMSPSRDMLSRWIGGRFIPWYHRKLGYYFNVRHFLTRAIWLWESIGSSVLTIHRSLTETQKAIVFGSIATRPLRIRSVR
jgi:hypothetical protein